MRHQNIVVFGGSGFIGHHLVARLAADGRRISLVTRRREHAQDLILLPTVDVIEGDLFDAPFLARVMHGQDAVINLIGVLHSDSGKPYGRAFAKAHVETVEHLTTAARNAGVPRFVQMSALGAAKDAPSMYLRSKFDGEACALACGLETTVFRPSVVFGPGDAFLNLFAKLQKLFPVMPLACSKARFEPVYVGDVAHAMFYGLDADAAYGEIYELAGPRIYTLGEIVRMAGTASGHPRPVLALPEALGRVQAGVMEILPGGPLMSRDNLDSMQVDNIASGAHPCLDAPELGGPNGLRPTEMETIAFEMLGGMHPRAHLDALRRRAHR